MSDAHNIGLGFVLHAHHVPKSSLGEALAERSKATFYYLNGMQGGLAQLL